MTRPAIIQVVEKLAFTIPEAVAASGLSRSAIYEEIAAGRLRAKKRGTTTIIRREDLAAFLAALPDREVRGRRG